MLHCCTTDYVLTQVRDNTFLIRIYKYGRMCSGFVKDLMIEKNYRKITFNKVVHFNYANITHF